MKTKIELGNEVTCIVTGFKGIATSRVEFINGCVQYCVKPKVKTDGDKMPDGEYIDVQQLKVTGEGIAVKKKVTGGVMKDLPRG